MNSFNVVRKSLFITTRLQSTSTSNKINDRLTAKRLLRLAAPHKGMIAGAVGLLSISSAVTMAVPYSMGAIIDAVSVKDAPFLSSIFLTLGGVFGIGAVANTGRIFLFKSVGERYHCI